MTPIGTGDDFLSLEYIKVATAYLLRRIHSTPSRDDIIRQRHAAGETVTALAREYGLSLARISQIVHRNG